MVDLQEVLEFLLTYVKKNGDTMEHEMASRLHAELVGPRPSKSYIEQVDQEPALPNAVSELPASQGSLELEKTE